MIRWTETELAAKGRTDKPERKVPAWASIPMREDASEGDFQARVLQLAKATGWSHYHTHDSRKSPAGFPDLVLWRDRVMFRELKTNTGTATPAQLETLFALDGAGADARVWRPKMWEAIVEELT